MKIRKVDATQSTIKLVVLVVAMSIIISVALIMLSPIFIVYEYLDPMYLGVISVCIHSVVCFLISVFCTKWKGIGSVVTLVAVAVWFLAALICGSIFYEDAYSNVLITGVVCLVSGGSARFLTKVGVKRRKRGINIR